MLFERELDPIRIFNWCGYEWRTSERWGLAHPDKPYVWYDPDCAKVIGDELHLYIKKDPKEIIGDTYRLHATYGCGLLSSTENNPMFKFGTYEWVAKLPKGKNLWPALWMWSFDSWPPEIDVVEAFSNCNGGYFKFNHKWKLFQWNVQTNFHVEGAKWNMAQCVPILKGCFKDPAKNFITYKLVWTPNYIEFYYDGVMIRRSDDKDLMKYLDDNTKKGMNVIMNTNPTDKYCDDHVSDPFIIKSFKYTPLETA